MTNLKVCLCDSIYLTLTDCKRSKSLGLNSPQVYLLQTGICKVVTDPLLNVPLLLNLMVVWQAIHFVNEHLKIDVWVDFVGPGHCEMQSA